MAKTKNFTTVLKKKLAENSSLRDAVEQQVFNARLAREIYKARNVAKLTQNQLAKLVGTQQSVISRLEDADYAGHSVLMLRKIAKALDCTLSVKIHPKDKDADFITTTEINTSVPAQRQNPSQTNLTEIHQDAPTPETVAMTA